MDVNSELLCREIDNEKLSRLLNSIASTVDETVNFGTQMIGWLNDTAGDHSIGTIILLLRHVVENADASSILIRESCIAPIRPLIRSIFEARLGLEYILEKDTFDRAIAYQVAHDFEKISLYKKADPKTKEGIRFRETLTQDVILRNIILQDFDTGPAIENLQKKHTRPEFTKISNEWSKRASKGGTPKWYSLFKGPTNVRELAKHLKYEGQYDYLYRHWSGSVHATDAMNSFQAIDGQGYILGLRSPKDLQSEVSLLLGNLIHIYETVIKKCLPSKTGIFTAWYINSIRDQYLLISSSKKLIEVR